MVYAAHVIENEQVSTIKSHGKRRQMQLRRLILLGLAAAMALATLAPMVVLAA